MPYRLLFVLLIAAAWGSMTAAPGLAAEVVTETVDYQQDGEKLQAFVASPTGGGPHPGVLVCHAWWGQDDHSRQSARKLAELGYVAVVLDMYGSGKHTDDPAQAKQWAGRFYGDREAFRQRAQAGLEVLKAQPNVDAERLAAIGYCFGGTTVLELAYAGADLAGVVSFHGGLMPPRDGSDDASRVSAKVLILHGQADPLSPLSDVVNVAEALQAADVDTTTILYSGAVHSFTDPGAEGELEGAQYDPAAAARSWGHMKLFLEHAFAEAQTPGR